MPVVDSDLRPLDGEDVLDSFEVVALDFDFPRGVVDKQFRSQLGQGVGHQELVEEHGLVLLQTHGHAQIVLADPEDLDDMPLGVVGQLKRADLVLPVWKVKDALVGLKYHSFIRVDQLVEVVGNWLVVDGGLFDHD